MTVWTIPNVICVAQSWISAFQFSGGITQRGGEAISALWLRLFSHLSNYLWKRKDWNTERESHRGREEGRLANERKVNEGFRSSTDNYFFHLCLILIMFLLFLLLKMTSFKVKRDLLYLVATDVKFSYGHATNKRTCGQCGNAASTGPLHPQAVKYINNKGLLSKIHADGLK